MLLFSPQWFSTSALMSLPAIRSACSEAVHPGMCVRAMPPTPMMPTLSLFAMMLLSCVGWNLLMRAKDNIAAHRGKVFFCEIVIFYP